MVPTVIVLVATLLLAACATPRMHTISELSSLGRSCGVAEGEILQDEEEPRVLILMRPGATPAERACVARWSRRNHLHLAWVEAVVQDTE